MTSPKRAASPGLRGHSDPEVWLRALPIFVAAASALASCAYSASQGRTDVAEPLTLELRLAEMAPAPGLREVTLPGSGELIYLHPEAALGSSAFSRVEATPGPEGLRLTLYFTPEGGRRLADLTDRNRGRRLALLAGTRLLAAPVIVERLEPGAGPVHAVVPLPEADARALAERLTSAS